MLRHKLALLAILCFTGLIGASIRSNVVARTAAPERERRVAPRPGGLTPTVALQPTGARKPLSSPADQPSSTPGQLTIYDKNGMPAGLCPLKDTDVTADIAGYVARVTVKQTFHNPSSTPIEAVYTFPLPNDAAVDDMTMTLGTRVIKGDIKRREEAREIYEAARDSGQSAALLDQERPNIFTQSVANVMPGEEVAITISYVHLLKYDEGEYEFTFPMVVGPRYIPNGGGYRVPGERGAPSPPQEPGFGGDPVATPKKPITEQSRRLNEPETPRLVLTRADYNGRTLGRYETGPSVAASETSSEIQPRRRPVPLSTPKPGDPLPPRVVTDADKITPPITPPGTRAGHDISLTVNIDAGLPVQNVRSTLHPISTTSQGPTRAIVRLKEERTIPNKDFILRYGVAGTQLQSGFLTHADGTGGGYFTLILQPPDSPPQSQIAPKEMVFVIDQTGSQSGWPMEKAKETMRYAIQNMNPGDTFQLIGFNTDLYTCFPGPVPNTPQNVAKALNFLAPIQGQGGTDILKSVDYALRLPDDPNRLRVICYMTDGYIGNDMQVLDYVKKHRGRARMFVFGIGNGVNRFLIDGMAKEGRGAAEYVTLETPGQEAAQRFYRRIASPFLLDPQVDWGGLSVTDVYPRAIPDVFSSGPIVIRGRYAKAGEGEVVLRGRLRGRPWSQRLHLNLPAVDRDGSALATLWAREKIEDLQSQDWMGAQTGKPVENIKEQIVRTALDHRLMSQYTSFVAVEQRVVNVNGRPRTVDVPVEMPEGVSYDGIFGKDAAPGLAGPQPMALYRYGTNGVTRARSGRMLSESLSAGAVAAPKSARPMSLGLPSQKPNAALRGAQGGLTFEADESEVVAELRQTLATGTAEAEKKLKAMKPEERREALSQAKLAPVLQGLPDLFKKEGKGGSLKKPGKATVDAGRVTVQLWLNSLPADGLKQLQSLGFKLDGVLLPGKLLLGSLPVEKLDALIELSFVRRVEPPKFR